MERASMIELGASSSHRSKASVKGGNINNNTGSARSTMSKFSKSMTNATGVGTGGTSDYGGDDEDDNYTAEHRSGDKSSVHFFSSDDDGLDFSKRRGHKRGGGGGDGENDDENDEKEDLMDNIYDVLYRLDDVATAAVSWRKLLVALTAFAIALALANIGTAFAAARLATDTAVDSVTNDLVSKASRNRLATTSRFSVFWATTTTSSITNNPDSVNSTTISTTNVTMTKNDALRMWQQVCVEYDKPPTGSSSSSSSNSMTMTISTLSSSPCHAGADRVELEACGVTTKLEKDVHPVNTNGITMFQYQASRGGFRYGSVSVACAENDSVCTIHGLQCGNLCTVCGVDWFCTNAVCGCDAYTCLANEDDNTNNGQDSNNTSATTTATSGTTMFPLLCSCEGDIVPDQPTSSRRGLR